MSKNNVSFGWAFKEFIWPRRKVVSLGLFLIIVRSLSGLVLPYASKSLIDDVIPSKDTDSLTLLLVVVCSALLFQSISSFSLTRILSVLGDHRVVARQFRSGKMTKNSPAMLRGGVVCLLVGKFTECFRLAIHEFLVQSAQHQHKLA